MVSIFTATANAGGGTTQTVSQGGSSAEDSNPTITSKGQQTGNTITINAGAGTTANVTIKDTNISPSSGNAAIKTEGKGNVNLNVEGTNSASSGDWHAGVEKSNGGKLTIGSESGEGKLTANGGEYGAGIGGGDAQSGNDITITGGNITAVGKTKSSRDVGGAGIGGGGNQTPDPGIGSNIKITGGSVTAVGGNYAAGIGGSYLSKGENITIIDAEVIAKGGANGAGIGGGDSGDGSNISISGNANVKAAGGASDGEIGDGAAIGAGGTYRGGQPVRGEERDVNTSGLTGSIDRLPAGTTFDIPQPKPRSSFPKPAPDPVAVEEEPQQVKAALYRVIDDAGKALPVETKQEDGVLLLTAQADIAILEGAISGLQTLQSRGIDTITFTNGTISVSFSLAEVTAKGASSDVYRLTLSGGEANFTLADADITALLGK